MKADLASSSLLSILETGCVEPLHHAKLQSLLAGLDYCSLGVCIKEYETVITTDNLLSVGFTDLSLCPVKQSVVGSVITRGVGYHDNIPDSRSSLPVDTVRSRYKHGVNCMACVPITLTPLALDNGTAAPRRTVGAVMVGSCKLNGVLKQHALLAQEIADAMAPSFVEATSDMYNNITDYVLGPMHGQRAPQRSSPRPIPTPPQSPLTRCQDDSDSDDDDHHPGPSGAPLRIPVPSRSQSALLSASPQYGTTPPSPPSFVAQTSTELLPPPLSWQSGESQQQASVTSSTGALLGPRAQSASESEPEISPAPDAQQHSAFQQSAAPQRLPSEGQQPVLVASSKGISELLALPAMLGKATKVLGRRSLSLSYMARGVRQAFSLSGSQLPDQHAKRKPSSDFCKQQESASKGCDESHDGKRHQPDGKAGNGFADGKHHQSHSKGWVESRDGQAKDGAVGQQADSKPSIPVKDGLVVSIVNALIGGKQPDGKQSDRKQPDGKQSDGKQSDGKQSDGKQSDGKQLDGKSKNGHNEFVNSDKGGHVAFKQALYTQHRFLLTYQDPHIERAYCVWQARYRTKLQLCFALAIIAVAMCMAYVTPGADRSPLLWWPLLIQLVPICAMISSQSWYFRHCEVMHVIVNVVKTIWAVSMGIPCPGGFWNSRRRLALMLKFSMDNLVISGLGDLARFTIFMPVQALDLAIVTASSGVLCKHPVTDHAAPWQCVVTALVGHILVAYLTVGALVWYMDRQARRAFVLQRQLE